jgi:type VI secretion system secreted protein Hcp
MGLFYVTIKGRNQGTFKGPGTRGASGRIPVVSFEYGVESPRDAATGLPSGRRQHRPVIFKKEIDASSPQLFLSAVTNESLTEVQFEFIDAAPDGREEIEYKVTLTNASVASFKESVATGERGGPAVDSRLLDEVSLTYQKIEVEYVPSKIQASDTWEAVT